MTATITEIRPLPSDPNMRRVRVGNRTVVTLRACDIESLGLEVGMSWTPAREKAAQELVALLQARRHAMKLLGSRAYSRGELIQRLVKRGCEQAIANKTADEMEREGWIDDEVLAAAISEELIRRKSASRAMIRAKLVSRKVGLSLAEKSADAAAASAGEYEIALNLGRRKLKALRERDRTVAARRIAATLSRKGYDDDIIQRVLDELGLLREATDDA